VVRPRCLYALLWPPRHLVSILRAPLGCPEVSALKYCTPIVRCRPTDLGTRSERVDAFHILGTPT
jgi:hypothetical protein